MIAAFLFSFILHAQTTTFTVEGVLLERGTQIPLKEINVFVLPHKLKATTDDKGKFVFADVPEGEFQFVVNATNYTKLEKNDFADSRLRVRTLYLEKEKYSGFETTIVDKKNKRDDAAKSLTQDQFLNLPGSGGDPVKAVQNMPGVNRVQGFSSQVVIQGAAPKDTAYDLEGHRIPLVFHFGGITSVVMPEAIERVDYLSAGYGPEYSRALGGVISLKTRKPDVKDRAKKGFFFVDTLKTGGLYEAQIDEKQSFLISGRYSYIGFVLKQVLKDNEQFNLTVAPEFSDLSVIYNNEISDKDNLKVLFIASRDYLGFLFKEPVRDDPKIRGNLTSETIFTRLIPMWTRKLDSDRTTRLSVGIGQDQILTSLGEIYFRLKSNTLSTRGEWEQKVNSLWLTQLGFDNIYSRATVDLNVPQFREEGGVRNPVSASETKAASVSGRISNIGLYFRNELAFSPQTVVLPSIRLDSFSQTKEKVFSPRLGIRHKLSDYFSLKAASGIYFQPPEPQEIDETYGNPEIKSPKSVHATLGFEYDQKQGSSEGSTYLLSYFDRWFTNLVVQSSDYVLRNGNSVPEIYNNSGGGRAYGVEAQWKYDLAPFSGWLTYTWSKSTRWSPSRPEYDFEYDQTHNINLITSYDFPRNWKLSARYRHVTGNPYTPIVSATFDADNDVYIPKRGALYSKRMSDFSQLDLRLDKKFILDTEIWSLYLDIQNLLNKKNPESLQYAYDYSKSEEISGLPILPSIGIKGEF